MHFCNGDANGINEHSIKQVLSIQIFKTPFLDVQTLAKCPAE